MHFLHRGMVLVLRLAYTGKPDYPHQCKGVKNGEERHRSWHGSCDLSWLPQFSGDNYEAQDHTYRGYHFHGLLYDRRLAGARTAKQVAEQGLVSVRPPPENLCRFEF